MAKQAITTAFISLVLSLGIALSLASADMLGRVTVEKDDTIHAVSSFIGLPVKDFNDIVVGEISDIIVDLATNQVGYAVVSMEGRDILVPWQAVTVRPEDAVATLSLYRYTLTRAPTMPAMIDQTFGREAHEHFGVTPYWTEELPRPEVAPVTPGAMDPWRGLPGQPYPHRIDPPMGGSLQ